MAENTETVSLRVQDEVFSMSKELLTEHSLYFRAMFSGNYREAGQDTINLEVIDAVSMNEILEFIKTETIICKEVQDRTRLLRAAAFLQIESLVSTLEKLLTEAVNMDTWLIILEAAESTNTERLARHAAAIGLYNLPLMLERVHLFPTLGTLHWYLSHSSLIAINEIQIFNLGAEWITCRGNVHQAAIFVVLGSLCFSSLKDGDFIHIANSVVVNNHARAYMLIKALHLVLKSHGAINMETVTQSSEIIQRVYCRSIYEEAMCLMSSSVKRGGTSSVTCVTASNVTMDSNYRDPEPEFIYRLNRESDRLERWLQAGAGLWGWVWAAWGGHRIVVTGGEYGRGTGRFQKYVAVYDTLTMTWTRHETELPNRRHCGAIIHGNTLYLIGGIGTYRTILSTCVAYDLVKRRVQPLPDLPARWQSPAVCLCIHNDSLYVASQDNIYSLTKDGSWETLSITPMKAQLMLSWRGDLHIVRSNSSELEKVCVYDMATKKIFRSLETVKVFRQQIANICVDGDKLVAFTHSLMREDSYVELDCDEGDEYLSRRQANLRYHTASGCAAVYIDLPQVQTEGKSSYALKYLSEIEQEDITGSDRCVPSVAETNL